VSVSLDLHLWIVITTITVCSTIDNPEMILQICPAHWVMFVRGVAEFSHPLLGD
jgi:hypothetical protein